MSIYKCEEVFICNEQDCNREFMSKYALNSHKTFHKEGYKNKVSNQLTIARKISNIKIKCDICDKSFVKSNFSRHYNSHFNKINKCLKCENETSNKFCSKSCSASYNNSLRKHTDETKQKISIANTNKTHNRIPPKIISCRVSFKPCILCNKLYTVKTWGKPHRTTCSSECAESLKATKSIKTKRYNYRGIQMQSSWEVDFAIILDSKSINWIRPNHIPWIDENQKNRKYYPDFYLIDFDLYVDTKNPYLQNIDKYKTDKIKEKVNLLVGTLEECINKVVSLPGAAPG